MVLVPIFERLCLSTKCDAVSMTQPPSRMQWPGTRVECIGRGTGVGYEGWGVVVAVNLSCPPWCQSHRARESNNPSAGFVHCGPELVLDIAEVVVIGVVRRISVRVIARDHGESRKCVIEMVDPHGVGMELTAHEARQAVQMLIDAADVRLTSADGECPSWCLEHFDPDPDDPDDEREHRGPFQAMVVAGTHEPSVTLGVRVRAFDEEYGRRVSLDMLVQSVATELLGAEACKLSAYLLDCVDLAELVEVA